MGDAKRIRVRPISGADANRITKKLHYSGKVVPNSQLHLGVYLDGKCGGVMQFGPSLCKEKLVGLVTGTGWNDFLELNRMAFADWLPRNSESRALGWAMRWLRKQYPHLQWVVSFADATQCGDGTIYRAAGFALTGIKVNNSLRLDPATGQPTHVIAAYHKCKASEFNTWEALQGHQLRYLYFLHPTARERLTVPVLPYSAIDAAGARMYKGVRQVGAGGVHPPAGGSSPTRTLQEPEA